MPLCPYALTPLYRKASDGPSRPKPPSSLTVRVKRGACRCAARALFVCLCVCGWLLSLGNADGLEQVLLSSVLPLVDLSFLTRLPSAKSPREEMKMIDKILKERLPADYIYYVRPVPTHSTAHRARTPRVASI